MMREPSPLLEVEGISKSFVGHTALNNVDFTLYAGEVHALLGENGAGKSTLIKLITGVHQSDSGTIRLNGRLIEPRNPRHAQELGISAVYQEINLVPTLSVAENIFVGRQPTRWGFVNMRETNRRAEALLKTFNIELDVTRTLSSYSIAIQQLIAIARGVDLSAKVLILDEPTSSLDANEVKTLFQVIHTLKSQGIGIILITHFLDQVYEISDRITILRNGQKAGEHLTQELPRMQLISEMLGKELTQALDSKEKAVNTGEREIFIDVQNFAKEGVLAPFDLQVHKGEIVGLAGLLGSGRTEMAQLIFGVQKSEQGRAFVKGRQVSLNSPRQAIQHGFALCPEDRKVEGIVGELTVRENIILALQAKMGWFNYLSPGRQSALADEMIKALRIATTNAEKPVRELSGGNQQKVILARWLVSRPEFLILDEPTRGIDVGAHAEIINIIKNLCRDGLALLVISSELAEIVDYSDRIVVLRDHKKIAELEGEQISEHAIMQTIAGH